MNLIEALELPPEFVYPIYIAACADRYKSLCRFFYGNFDYLLDFYMVHAFFSLPPVMNLFWKRVRSSWRRMPLVWILMTRIWSADCSYYLMVCNTFFISSRSTLSVILFLTNFFKQAFYCFKFGTNSVWREKFIDFWKYVGAAYFNLGL